MNKIMPISTLITILFCIYFYFNKKNTSNIDTIFTYLFIVAYVIFLVSYIIKYFT